MAMHINKKQQCNHHNQKSAYPVQFFLSHQAGKISINERLVHTLDPKNILKRGYSITLKNGQLVTTFESIAPDDQLETILFNGKIQSTVISSTTES